MSYRTVMLAAAAVVVLAAVPAVAQAQLGERLKRKVEQRVDRKVDQAVDRALDTVECMVTDPTCRAKAEKEGKKVVLTGAWPGAVARYGHHYASVGHWRGPGVWQRGNHVSMTQDQRSAAEIVRARIMADGPYVKVYVNEKRVGNLPRADMPRGGTLTFWLDGRPDSPVYVGDIRVASGGRDLYDALEASGRVATQGIYFDTGSDVPRPESSGTLKAIAQMLEAHATLALTIEGHTDDVGDAAANRALSERRAAAVKAALVSRDGVDAARLQSAGLGDTKPAAPNATPEGRQQNRRVELVRN